MVDAYAFGAAAVFPPGSAACIRTPIFEVVVRFPGQHTSLKHAWIEWAVESAVRLPFDVHRKVRQEQTSGKSPFEKFYDLKRKKA